MFLGYGLKLQYSKIFLVKLHVVLSITALKTTLNKPKVW